MNELTLTDDELRILQTALSMHTQNLIFLMSDKTIEAPTRKKLDTQIEIQEELLKNLW